MKPFNLKEALNGARVVTRDGRNVTEIIVLKSIRMRKDKYRIVAVIDEEIHKYYADGKFSKHQDETQSDLFMADKPAKSIWINVFKNIKNNELFISNSYRDNTEALNEIRTNDAYNEYIKTMEINDSVISNLGGTSSVAFPTNSNLVARGVINSQGTELHSSNLEAITLKGSAKCLNHNFMVGVFDIPLYFNDESNFPEHEKLALKIIEEFYFSLPNNGLVNTGVNSCNARYQEAVKCALICVKKIIHVMNEDAVFAQKTKIFYGMVQKEIEKKLDTKKNQSE